MAAITSSAAEAYYGTSGHIRQKALTFLDKRLLKILMDFERVYPMSKASKSITKTSRLLVIFHLFQHCQEASFKEITDMLPVSQKIAYQDIRLLKQAGVLQIRYARNREAFVPTGLAFTQPKELERRYMRYLMAGDYRGGAFLNAVLISEGLVLLTRYDGETSGTRFFAAKTGTNCLAKPCGAILARST